MDSEGLLLLSDEPRMNSKLLAPENAHPRTYHAQVDGVPKPQSIDTLCGGSIVIRGYRCRPCSAYILDQAPNIPPRDPPIRVRKEIPDTWIQITLFEGKNRQVRRMTAAIGHPTLRLIRVAIGGFSSTTLTANQWKILRTEEIESIGI